MSELEEPGGKVRLCVATALGDGARVSPSDAQAHYLLHVMRAKQGDRVSLFNGRDGEWLARMEQVTKRGCVLVCEKRTRAQDVSPDVWLCFAPIKKTPADYVVQKATELGVSAFVPVFTRRTIVTRVNRERMSANAVEAAEQSDRLTVPEIREAVTLDKLLKDWPRERRMIFCDEGGPSPPKGFDAASESHSARRSFSEGGNAKPIVEALAGVANGLFAILTGPEGGFDPTERERIRSHEFVLPVTLGPRILRADTAALAALAVWQAMKGDLAG